MVENQNSLFKNNFHEGKKPDDLELIGISYYGHAGWAEWKAGGLGG